MFARSVLASMITMRNDSFAVHNCTSISIPPRKRCLPACCACVFVAVSFGMGSAGSWRCHLLEAMFYSFIPADLWSVWTCAFDVSGLARSVSSSLVSFCPSALFPCSSLPSFRPIHLRHPQKNQAGPREGDLHICERHHTTDM